MSTKNNITPNVTVIGLGQMGFTLAKLLLTAGYRVTVWNRTKSKAAPLIEMGAVVEENIARAIANSETVVICLFDYNATKAVISAADVKAELTGKTIIQFTTGSPQEAIESENFFREHGAHYLDGAIQVAPDQMARPDTTIFISGQKDVFTKSQALLQVFGGNIKYLSERISAAAAMDLASLSYLYGALIGFFHAVQIAQVEGFNVELLGEVVKEISPGYAEFMQYESKVVQSGNFEITQSPLAISVDATQRIHQSSLDYGINTEVSALIANFFKRASEAGLGRQELASIVKVFR